LESDKGVHLNFEIIEREIKRLEIDLRRLKIHNSNEFKKWQRDFIPLYGKKYANLKLYLTYSILYFMAYLFVLKFVLKDDKSKKKVKKSLEIFKEFQEKIYLKLEFKDLFNVEYFNSFFKINDNNIIKNYISFLMGFFDYLTELNLQPEYIFDYLIQRIVSPITRHKTGEYYTPPFLIKEMIKKSYKFGQKVLDPCCGIGNFLIEIIKLIKSSENDEKEKLDAINSLYGFDINPFSIFIAKINFIYLLKSYIPKVNLNLYIGDSLFPENNFPKIKVDLVIGNPPWYTYSEIESPEYQNKIKKLAEILEIKPTPKNILNIEISSLFFYQTKNIYLKSNGIIFFVITEGVITGSHASLFRNFKGFSNIQIWVFDKIIKNIFNINFICLYAQKSKNFSILDKYEIPTYNLMLKNNFDEISNYKNIEIEIKPSYKLVPYSIVKRGKNVHVKKLIPKEIKETLLPSEESYYRKLFHKGADLNPRNLIFVTIKKMSQNKVKISPNEEIFKRAKSPWDVKEFENEIVEEKYIFKAIKSTELVKFHVFGYYYVFLPLDKKNLKFQYDKLTKNSKLFYDKINQIYLKKKKSTTENHSLMDNLNRWNKLINSRQLSKIKIIYNNSGSMINAAVVQGDFIITGDCSYYNTNDIEEAYYLAAILNGPLMTTQIKIKKSSRHIFKIPFENPIKKFNSNNPTHRRLSELGEMGTIIAKSTVKDLFNQSKEKISKIRIQEVLGIKLNPILNQIDEVLKLELL